jgi:hypothetical protein
LFQKPIRDKKIMAYASSDYQHYEKRASTVTATHSFNTMNSISTHKNRNNPDEEPVRV